MQGLFGITHTWVCSNLYLKWVILEIYNFIYYTFAVLYLVTSCVWLFATPQTIACQAPPPMGTLQARILEWVAMLSSRRSQLGIEPRSPTLQADSLPSEAPWTPKDAGVGSLSLLQGNFWTQVSNWGLLHCKQILYQLSYQGSPYIIHACNWVWVEIK